MEAYYKSYGIMRAIIHSDCNMPPPVLLADSGDRYIADELIKRKNFPALEISQALTVLGQPGLIATAPPPTGEIQAVASTFLTV